VNVAANSGNIDPRLVGSDRSRGHALAARPAAIQVIIAGTAGGVGTTTVAALLFAAMSADRGAAAPQLLDHSGGVLGLRLPEGDEAVAINPSVVLHDLGPHALVEGVDRLADQLSVLVVVAAATPAGCAQAGQLLEEVKERYGSSELRRVIVVLVGVFGRHRISREIAELRARAGARSVVLFPQDLSLAAGGRIPQIRLTTGTRRSQRQLTSILRERLSRP
jgi:hypothetical protein